MKNLQVYQLMRLITIILPITDHTVIYIILKGSHSLCKQSLGRDLRALYRDF